MDPKIFDRALESYIRSNGQKKNLNDVTLYIFEREFNVLVLSSNDVSNIYFFY